MNKFSRSYVLLALMLVAAAGAFWLRPTQRIADEAAFRLEAMVPAGFGEWREFVQPSPQIVDPQMQKTVERIYSQTLSRTYENADGYRIMLSIAYSNDQRDVSAVHYPEVCYPAQGFDILSEATGNLDLHDVKLPVRRLQTSFGTQRYEPVTYWTMVGSIPSLGGIDKKMAEMHYGLQGKIPDGLLFRVSSIDANASRAFEIQSAFVGALIEALEPGAKNRLAGIHG